MASAAAPRTSAAAPRTSAAALFAEWARREPMRLLPGVALNVHPDTWDAVVALARERRERPSAVVRSLLEHATHTVH